jgi:hypothetical protein
MDSIRPRVTHLTASPFRPRHECGAMSLSLILFVSLPAVLLLLATRRRR